MDDMAMYSNTKKTPTLVFLEAKLFHEGLICSDLVKDAWKGKETENEVMRCINRGLN